jgi:DNA-binding CsgD family transcriptional regulator
VKGSSYGQTYSSSPGRLSINGHEKPRFTHHLRKPMLNRPLSLRERQVAKLVAHGMTNKEIAEMIGGITEQSVKNLVAHIMMKTGTPNRVRIVIWALKNDLINVENL